MFLDTLRQHKFIACGHADKSLHVEFKEDGDRILKCKECDCALSLKLYFRHFLPTEDFFEKVEEYLKWNTDRQVPLGFKAYLFRNWPLRVKTDYDTAFKGSLILQMLHSPFASAGEEPTPEGLRFIRETIDEGLEDLIRKFRQVGREGAEEAIAFLKDIFDVERYFEVLAPYVKKALERETVPHAPFDTFVSIGEKLSESYRPRGWYSRFCVSFDEVHVAALCFLCRGNLDLAGKLALYFSRKTCRGYYERTSQPTLDPLELQFSNARPEAVVEFTETDLPERPFEWVFSRTFFSNYAKFFDPDFEMDLPKSMKCWAERSLDDRSTATEFSSLWARFMKKKNLEKLKNF